MSRYFTKTFFRFLCAFLVILAAAAAVMVAAGVWERPANPVDNVAVPQ